MFKYIILLFSFLSGVSSAQVNQINSKGTDYFISTLYDSLIGSNSKIFNGKKFHEPLSKELIEGNLYFRDDDWTTGTLGYRGEVYPGVTMRYHTFLDKLILLSPGGYEGIEAPVSNIDFFIIHTTRFERLTEPQAGYYAVIHDGVVGIYAQHYSKRHEKTTTSNMVTELEAKEKYFIVKNNNYSQVKSKSSVLKVLSEQKSELRKFLRDNKISYSQNRQYALQLLGKEYDRLQSLK